MKNILGCCDSTTAVIDDKGYLQCTGDNRFTQIDLTKKEYNTFQKLSKAKFVSAGNTSIGFIDENNKLIIQGRVNISKNDVKFVSVGSSEIACIDTDDNLWYFKDNDFVNSRIKSKFIACSDKIEYIGTDNYICELDDTKNIKDTGFKAKSIYNRYNKNAYIDMDNTLWINGKSTKIKAQKIAFGFDFMVILDTDGFIRLQGSNNYKQFGKLPKLLEEITLTDIKATDIACGTYHFVYMAPNGLECCGYNYNGQLGTINSKNINHTGIKGLSLFNIFKNVPSVKNAPKLEENAKKIKVIKKVKLPPRVEKIDIKMKITPKKIKDRTDVKIEYGKDFVALIDKQHNLYIKGKNSYKQFGDAIEIKTFTKIYSNVKDVACGFGHIIVLTNSNDILVTGMNYYGQLGLKHNENISKLTETGLKGDQVMAGNWTSMFKGMDGLLYESGLIGYEQINEFKVQEYQ